MTLIKSIHLKQTLVRIKLFFADELQVYKEKICNYMKKHNITVLPFCVDATSWVSAITETAIINIFEGIVVRTYQLQAKFEYDWHIRLVIGAF